MFVKFQKIALFMVLLFIQGCEDGVWNNPYPELDGSDNTLYSAFSERPKHLDPAVSYTTDEWIFINQIYEPPYQYDYLKRPYEVIPQTATALPAVRYLDKQDKELPAGTPVENIAYSVYRITIKPGIYYAAHPAFAKNQTTGNYLYHQLTPDDVKHKHTIQDFKQVGTRELVAEDYIYQIKRLADPTLNSPILGLMENYIVGIKAFGQLLQTQYKQIGASLNNITYLDLRPIPFVGVTLIDKYTYEVKIYGKSPQFLYWLAMPFYSPMPWEAVKFYSQPLLLEKNISLDWYPVGTGPFVLTKNNPNLNMVMEKNPSFHGELYPSSGEPDDAEKGLLKRAGQPLPFLDKIVFILEREGIPYWSKFLQGYYDQSLVSSQNFDQALRTGSSGNFELSQDLSDKGIKLSTSVQPTIFYWGFNMVDDVVGGYTITKKKLRQAISIAVDMEEYINIFLNGNGIVAQGPLPPTIFGSKEEGANPYIYNIDPNTTQIKRKSLAQAKQLLSEAGYPGGIDPKTQKPLILYYDAIVSGGPESQTLFSWLRKEFNKIGIELVVRATQYSRFQDKISNGDFQIYSWGWNADYPDPENFFFLLYGKNGKVKYAGENASNYDNKTFDALYEQMKNMENTDQRADIIAKMIAIVQEDAPWMFGYYPKTFTLRQAWVAPFKTNAMSRNTLKYMAINPHQRAQERKKWNQAFPWPLGVGVGILILICIPAGISYRRKMHQPLTLIKTKDEQE